jgi:uncharacterized protein (TIGR03086 family)
VSVNLRYYIRALYGLDHVLRLVGDEAWDAPSPCEGWTVRDVTGHAIGVVSNVAARCGFGDVVDVFADPPRGIAGDDPYGAWTEILNRVTQVLDEPGVLQREMTSSLGVMSLDDFLAHMGADTVIHTWDIARGAGVDERLDASLVRYVDDVVRGRGDAFNRGPRRFVAASDVDAGADAQTRLLAFTGRRVAR